MLRTVRAERAALCGSLRVGGTPLHRQHGDAPLEFLFSWQHRRARETIGRFPQCSSSWGLAHRIEWTKLLCNFTSAAPRFRIAGMYAGVSAGGSIEMRLLWPCFCSSLRIVMRPVPDGETDA